VRPTPGMGYKHHTFVGLDHRVPIHLKICAVSIAPLLDNCIFNRR
jgi:hypothetical protein